MKMLSFIIVLIMFPGIFAVAQTPCYFIFYGNTDGSTIDVRLDSDIRLNVWAATPAIGSGCEDLNGDGVVDSISFMHIPLASNDSIIISRDGGEYYYPLDQWDDVSFMPPDLDSPIIGYTNQSLMGFADIIGGPNPLLNTEGDTVLLFTFYMHTTSDTAYLGQLVCPFMEGFNPAGGGLLCGMQDGWTPIVPLQTFSCLYFVNYLAGDANGSGFVNGVDVIYLVAYFKGYGPPPDPILAGDANGDCMTDAMDVSYIINYCKGGPEPLYGNCH